MKIETGTYVGDGTDNRLIATTFKPEVIMLRGNAIGFDVMETRWRTASMPGDMSKPLHELPTATNNIQSFTNGGFTVGTVDGVNDVGVTYYWLALARNIINDLAVFAYLGNSADNRDIVLPNTPFQPDLIMVCGRSSTRLAWKTYLMPAGDFSSDVVGGGSATAYSTNRIQAINPDGFQVGSNTIVNQNNVCYDVVCAKIVPGLFNLAHYDGNGVDNRVISLGLQPTFVWTSSPKLMVNGSSALRTQFHVGDSSIGHSGNYANESNGIKEILASGIKLGTNDKVNQLGGAPGTFYDVAAFKDGVST